MSDLDTIKILCFGDSLTSGFPGYDPEFGGGDVRSQYGYWLVQEAKREYVKNIVFDNKGIPGELATRMHPRLKHEFSNHDYHMVILLGGSNDLGWGVSVDEIFASLERMWGFILSKGSKLIACTVPPVAANMKPFQKRAMELNERIVNAQYSVDMRVVDLFHALANEDGILIPAYDVGDGVHLSVEGYRKMGATIWHEGVKGLLRNEA